MSEDFPEQLRGSYKLVSGEEVCVVELSVELIDLFPPADEGGVQI